jgi:hypothetical protein
MDNALLFGIWRMMISVPSALWQNKMPKLAARWDLSFMTADHHRVRDFAVRELPRFGRPLSPELIADELQLPADRVSSILDELERHMTFLFRNQEGEVTWAYPVTVDETPHRVTFDSGEKLYAA